MKLGAGHPMGPLALLDFVGLDVSAAIGESIGADVPDRVRELVAEGKLGRKCGRGLLRLRLSRPARLRGDSAVAIPAARSQTTSASPMPCCPASSVTRSQGSVASGRSSQRARSSASSAPSSAGLILLPELATAP